MEADCEILPPQVEYWLSAESNHDCFFIVGPESGSERIGTFKTFLTGYSEPLRAMLQDSALREQGDIIVTDIQPKTFRNFLKCLYMACTNIRKVSISFKDAVDLLYVTDKYLVTFVQEELVKRIKQEYPFTLTNILIALDSPVFLQQKCLKGMLEISLKSSIDDIFSSSSFLNISAEALLWILKLDSLAIDEITLWERLLRWAKHNTKSDENSVLRQYMLKHLKFIRFCTMSCKDFNKKVVPSDILTHTEVYEICKSFGLKKCPTMEFICNDINIRHIIPQVEPTLFYHSLTNIQKFKGESTSQGLKFKHVILKIKLGKQNNDFSFFLYCTSSKPKWQCFVNTDFILINHTKENRVFNLKHMYANTTPSGYGFENFCDWDKIIKEENGYVKFNKIHVAVIIHQLSC